MTERLFKRGGQTWSISLIGLVPVFVGIVWYKMQMGEAKDGNETSSCLSVLCPVPFLDVRHSALTKINRSDAVQIFHGLLVQ